MSTTLDVRCLELMALMLAKTQISKNDLLRGLLM